LTLIVFQILLLFSLEVLFQPGGTHFKIKLTFNIYLHTDWLKVRMPLRRGVLDATLCDKVCQWLATGRWFSPGTPVSSTNKTYHLDATKILLRMT
jgi:hypothetical protein